jgi:nitrite reductase/ring-hydroxylating ferredoxin subunit
MTQGTQGTNEVNAWTERPDGLELLTRYERTMPVTPEGIWRNVLDYEHLPWVHGHAFAGVELLTGGRDWWRCRVALTPVSMGRFLILELRVDRAGLRYVTRTLEGPGVASYILTSLRPIDEQTTAIDVEFWAPAGRPLQTAKSYLVLYEKLWDEDEAMIRGMLVAQDRRPWTPQPGARLRVLGPSRVTDDERELGLAEHDGRVWVHDAICPHMGGPLVGAEVDEQARLRCPWHDYRFALADGRCDRANLRLSCRLARRIDADHLEI